MNFRSLFCFFAFLCVNIVQSQEILFFEDFNQCALSDQWSYTLEGNQNVAWAVGIPTNPKAEGKSIDGTCMLYIDDDLTGDKTLPFKLRVVSKYFNGSGFSEILFKAQVHFRRDKTEVMRLIIDNGDKEFIIREFKNSNFSGSSFSDFVNIQSDLSFIASDSMRLIIEYDDDNQWGWWAGVDNISITGKGQGDIVFYETFNDCTLPQGWSTEVLTGNDDWQFGVFFNGRTMDGTCFAYFNDDIIGETAPPSKIRLASPFFNASDYADYVLTYDLIFRTVVAGEYLQLYIDNGKEWIPVKTYSGDWGGPDVNLNKKDSINLSEYRADQIRLIWEYADGSGWAWWVGLDNVKIVGNGDINDRCSKAIDITSSMDCLYFNNNNALSTDELIEKSENDAVGYLYYRFEPNESKNIKIHTKSIFNDQIEIFTGDCETATLVTSKNWDEYGFLGEEVYITTQANQAYIIRISGKEAEFGLHKGNGCLKIEEASNPNIIPSNDPCTAAQQLLLDQNCLGSENLYAVLDGPLPTTNIRSRADVWYSFTPNSDGDFRFVCETNFSEALAVFVGDCANLTEINSNFTGQNIDLKAAQIGLTYYIQVSSYFAILEGQVCGAIVPLTEENTENDQCVDALPISLNQACSSSNNNSASFSGIRPTCDVYMEADVWFSFVAPPSGEVFVRAKVDFEHNIAIYKGLCNQLTSIFCERQAHHCNGYTRINLLVPGQVYFVQIGARKTIEGFSTGNICLEILDYDPNWTPITLDIAQECVSKGAVLFTPTANGGHGQLTISGMGLQTPVLGNNRYVIEAKDEDGCVTTALISAQSCNDVGCQLVADISKTNATCFGQNDGQINIALNGGVGPYKFLWSNGLEGSIQNSLAAGTYQISIIDHSGCELTEVVPIFQPAQILTNSEVVVPFCHDDNTGNIKTFVIGGVGPYLFNWSNGTSEEMLNNISSGEYTLTITDAIGCIKVENYDILAPDSIQISSNLTHNNCFGDSLGSISLEVKGGTMPYLIDWNGGSSSQSLNFLPAGEYNVRIVDAHLCTTEQSFEVLEPQEILLKVDSLNLVITENQNGFIKINIGGGTQPYFYQWYLNEVELSDSQTTSREISEAGTYNVVVTDALGCKFLSESWVFETTNSSIDLLTYVDLVLFPNPTFGTVYLKNNSKSQISHVHLQSLDGKRLNEIDILHINGELFEINLSTLPSTIYFLTVIVNNQIQTFKVVKVGD